MPVPDFQSMMKPILQKLGNSKQLNLQDIYSSVADHLGLTDEEREEMMPSRRQPRYANRAAWALLHLRKAGLVDRPERATYRITERGLQLLQEAPDDISMKDLQRFKEYIAFREKTPRKNSGNDSSPIENGDAASGSSPEESMDLAYQMHRKLLADELLTLIRGCSFVFFEKLVVELLVTMGYGGSLADAGRAVGRTGDEGIDGIIKEDILGLDVIYLQAKKWEAVIGRPEIQKFAGALQGFRAKKGVFITTSHFSKDAINYVQNIDSKIILLDGNKLAGYMIDYDLGVFPTSRYSLKNIDTDYFESEE